MPPIRSIAFLSLSEHQQAGSARALGTVPYVALDMSQRSETFDIVLASEARFATGC